MRARTAGVVLALSGLALTGTTLTVGIVPAAPAVQRVVGQFEPVMTPAGVEQLRADLAVVSAGTAGLTGQALPALAEAQGVTPAELQVGLAEQYRDVATGLQELPATLQAFTGFADLLEAQLANFEAVASLPVEDLEPTTIPPALLAVGVLLVLLGLGVLAAPGRAALPWAALGLGALVLAATLGASLPGKAGDADALRVALEPVMTQQQVDAQRADLAVLGAMAVQLQTELLPETAAALGTTPEQLAGQLVTASPELGALLAALPAVQARFGGLVDLLDANLADWSTATRPSLPLLVRLLLGTGLLAVASGVLALSGRRPRPVVVDLRDAAPPGPPVLPGLPQPRAAYGDEAARRS